MRGFLQKDIELLVQNRSLPGIILVMVVFMVCVKNESFIISYLGMMGGFMVMSTISYDEADHGMGFLMTLPSTRRIYAIEKYVMGYGVSFILLIIGAAVSAAVNLIHGVPVEKGEMMLNCEAGLLIVAVMMLVLVPVQLKFGADNGRIVMVAVFMCVFAAIYLAAQAAENMGVNVDQLLMDIQSFGIPAVLAVLLVLVGAASCISCLISIRIMERKEF